MRTNAFLRKCFQSKSFAYAPHSLDERYQMGIHESPTASADPAAPNVGMSRTFNGTLNASPMTSMRNRSLIFPVQAMIWKLIWRRKLKTRNGADHANILPDSSNFVPKNAMAKSVPKRPRARLAGIAATEKYFVKNCRMEATWCSSLLHANHETTGKRNPMRGVTSKNGIPMRLR